ncbi:MAG: hypothetical protein KIT17_22185 [Rubrivivax sp.]|nr:hypothetical protein [Rubrivivax sp.]
MALQLKTVALRDGPRWVADGFRAFGRRPMALGLLFLVFFAASTLVAALLPLVGGIVQLMAVPMLSLGYMLATQNALVNGPVHPGQFVEPLRGDPRRRRALLLLCASYGLLAFAILVLCSWVSDDALTRLQQLLSRGDATRAEIETLFAEGGVTQAMWLFGGLVSALSVPYWFAPALVHWGGQGALQALFSSTLAVWRNKGAFTTYIATWVAVMGLTSVVLSAVLSALGAARLALMAVVSMGLMMSAVFYVSQLFVFNDNFGGTRAADGSGGDDGTDRPHTGNGAAGPPAT